MAPVRREVEAVLREQGHRLGVVAVHARVELAEVDLERHRRRRVGGRREGEADLDEVERVHVGLERRVALRRGQGRVVLAGAVDHARELRVHGHVGEALRHVPDRLELRLHVVRPHLPDHQLPLPPGGGGLRLHLHRGVGVGGGGLIFFAVCNWIEWRWGDSAGLRDRSIDCSSLVSLLAQPRPPTKGHQENDFR